MWFECQKTHTHIERTCSIPNQGWIVLAPQQQTLTWILPDGQHRARCLLFQCSVLDPTASNIAPDSPNIQVIYIYISNSCVTFFVCVVQYTGAQVAVDAPVDVLAGVVPC